MGERLVGIFGKVDKATLGTEAQRSPLWTLLNIPELFSHAHCSGRAGRWQFIPFPRPEEMLL